MPEFHETVQGGAFYRHHVPQIVKSLDTIAGSLASLVRQNEQLLAARQIPQACLEMPPKLSPNDALSSARVIREQLPHLTTVERSVILRTILRDYCAQCGRPMVGNPHEIGCTCGTDKETPRDG